MQLTETEIYEIIKEEVKGFLDELDKLQSPRVGKDQSWKEPEAGFVDDEGNYIEGDPYGAGAPLQIVRGTRMRKVAKTSGKGRLHQSDVKRLRRLADKSPTA